MAANAFQAGAGRQVDQLGQIDLADAAILLEGGQDAHVSSIEGNARGRLHQATYIRPGFF